MKKYKTELKIKCAWCGVDMGTKDGGGVTGTTSGICPKCAKKEWAKLGGRPPARWNLVGRFLARRRKNRNARRFTEERKALRERADQDDEERANLEDLFATHPALHARVMLQGRRLVHYLLPEDLAEIESRVANEPEVRCKWN